MTMRDEAARSKAVQAVAIGDGDGYDGSNLTGTTIDRQPSAGQNFMSAKFILETGGGSSSDVVDLKLFESDDDSSYTEVTTVTIPNLNDAAEFDTVDVDLSGLGRYLQLQAASADQTVSSTVELAAYCLLTGAKENPCSDG